VAPASHARWIDKRITMPSYTVLTDARKGLFAFFDWSLPAEATAQLK
jgi:hypothetical protein